MALLFTLTFRVGAFEIEAFLAGADGLRAAAEGLRAATAGLRAETDGLRAAIVLLVFVCFPLGVRFGKMVYVLGSCIYRKRSARAE